MVIDHSQTSLSSLSFSFLSFNTFMPFAIFFYCSVFLLLTFYRILGGERLRCIYVCLPDSLPCSFIISSSFSVYSIFIPLSSFPSLLMSCRYIYIKYYILCFVSSLFSYPFTMCRLSSYPSFFLYFSCDLFLSLLLSSLIYSAPFLYVYSVFLHLCLYTFPSTIRFEDPSFLRI